MREINTEVLSHRSEQMHQTEDQMRSLETERRVSTFDPDQVEAPLFIYENNISVVRRLEGGLPKLIPTDSTQGIDKVTFYGVEIPSLWKANAYGKKNAKRRAERIGHHVDRFLASAEFTDKDVREVSKFVVDDTGLYNYILEQGISASKDGGSDSMQDMGALILLEQVKSDDSMGPEEIDNLIKSKPQYFEAGETELSFDSKYFAMHPQAAKTIMMYHLVKHINPMNFRNKDGDSDSGFADRLEGIRRNLEPLYRCLIESEDYQSALMKEKGISAATTHTEMHGRYKNVLAKELPNRMVKLDHAMKHWRHYGMTTRMNRLDDLTDGIYFTLKSYEPDMIRYLKEFGKEDTEQVRQVMEQIALLEDLRKYRRIPIPRPDQAEDDIQTRLGIRIHDWKDKKVFYKDLDDHLSKLEGGVAVKKKETAGEAEETDEELRKTWPPEVIDNVRRIDEWVANNVTKVADGNSEANFSMEILRRPFAQRLVAYYLLENGKRHAPAVTDIVNAQNGYVPDLAKFKKAMKATKWKVHAYAASALKDTDFTRSGKWTKRILGTTGSIYLKKLEDVLRIMDDKSTGFGDCTMELADQKTAAASDDAPEVVKVRQEKFMTFMDILTKHQELLKKNEEDAKKDEDTQKKIDDSDMLVKNAFNDLRDADQAVKDYIDQQTAEIQAQLQAFRSEISDTELEGQQDLNEKKDSALTADNYLSLGASLSQTIGGMVPEQLINQSARLKGLGWWDLSNKQIENCLFAEGALYSLKGALAAGALISNIVYVSRQWDNYDTTQHVAFVSKIASEGMTVASSATMATIFFMNRTRETIFNGITGAGKTMGDVVKKMGSVKAVGMTAGAVQVLTSMTDLISTTMDDSTQEKAGIKAQAMFDRLEENGADPAMLNRRKRALKGVRSIERQNNNRKEVKNTYAMLQGAVNMVGAAGAALPGVSLVCSAISGVMTVAATIHDFYNKVKEQDKVIDDFVGMNDLLEKYKETVPEEARDKMLMVSSDEADVKKLKPDEKDELLKNELRQMVLRQMGYSSYEELFKEVTTRYCSSLYEMIFMKDGKPIYKDDPEAQPPGEGEADAETLLRQSLMALFAPLKFEFPDNPKKMNGATPSPGKPSLALMITQLTSV